MAILADMKAFYRWLDEAGEIELCERRDRLVAVLPKLTDEGTAAECRRFVRLIEESMVARQMPPQ